MLTATRSRLIARKSRWPVLVAAVFGLTAALAQAQDDLDPGLILLANLRAGTQADAYLGNLQASLKALDSDGNGLDMADLVRREQRTRADAEAVLQAQREQAKQGFDQADANRDGRISRAEFTQWAAWQNSGRARVEPLFRMLDKNGDGLIRPDEMPGDRTAKSDREFAETDADHDGGISLGELLAKVPVRRETSPPDVSLFQQRDRNRDGWLSLAELSDLPSYPALDWRHLRNLRDRLARVMAADPDGDGQLTPAELAAVFRSGFARLDGDGNSVLSPAEYAAAQPQIDRAAMLAGAPLCPVPAPGARARAMAVAIGEGHLLSTVALESQDQVTTIADLQIEQGDAPLYLLVSSGRPVVWRLTGAVQRVERIAVFAQTASAEGKSLAAVQGVARDKVHFAPAACLSNSDLRSDANLSAALQVVAGITAQARSVPGGIAGVVLPDLDVWRANGSPPAPAGFDRSEWASATGFWPRGVARPDPAKLVAQVPVQDYAVLPAGMGAAQLVAQGVLKPTRNSSEYRIVRPLARFPGGMFGAHAANFVLPKGMKMPAGDQGHGCVYDDQGAVIGRNTSCIRTPRGPSLSMRVGQDGRGCLYSEKGRQMGCFPDDGRPLVVTRADGKLELKPAEPDQPADTAAPAPLVPVVAPAWRAPVEIIPAGLDQRW